MARHRVDPRSVSRAAPAGSTASTRPGRRHAASLNRSRETAESSTHDRARRVTSSSVIARRIALPAATFAVAGVVTVGGAVAFASSPGDGSVPQQRLASSAPAAVPSTRTETPAATDTPAGGVTTLAQVGAVTTSAPTTVGGQPAGSVAPSANDAAAISAAIKHSDLTSQVPSDDYRVVDAKLSRSDPTWAWAQLLPVTDTIDRAQGVLHRTASGWQLVQLGSYEVGCSVAPAQVLADLALECPPPGSSDFGG